MSSGFSVNAPVAAMNWESWLLSLLLESALYSAVSFDCLSCGSTASLDGRYGTHRFTDGMLPALSYDNGEGLTCRY